VIRSSNYDDVAWQAIDLEQQGTDYSLDLTCFVRIPSFFGNCIKFIEEKYARPYPYSCEEYLHTRRSFSEETTD